MKVGVVVFPGSNCDHDTKRVFAEVLGQEATFLWHKDADLQNVEAVVVPGGFAYGDYLRTGAIARFSPVMQAVTAFAERGGPVLGICNAKRNVVALMPHPERASEAILGNEQGRKILEAFVTA